MQPPCTSVESCLGQQFQPALQHKAQRSFGTTAMVGYDAMLRAVGANLVPALTRSNLCLALTFSLLPVCGLQMLPNSSLKNSACCSPVGVLAALGSFGLNSCRQMRHHDAGLSLVSMLSTRPRVFGRPNRYVRVSEGPIFFFQGLHHCNRHSRRVHAALALRRRHTLPPVPASF